MIITTSTPLTGNAEYVSDSTSVDPNQLRITGTVIADKAGTIYIEQSTDDDNWDVSTSYSISINNGKGFTEEIVADFWRVRYVNNSVAQGSFRLFARARP